MAGMHADRGIRTHKLNVTGETPAVGLRVFTNDWVWGTITKVDTRAGEETCGYYCEAWHTVTLDDGATVIYNCERLTTRKPR